MNRTIAGRRFRPLACVVVGAMVAGPGAHAEDLTLTGRSIQLETPCIASAAIGIDPHLHGGARLGFDGGGLVVHDAPSGAGHDGGTASIVVSACGGGRLRLALAPDTGLDIAASRTTPYVVRGALAALSASLSGGSLDVEQVRAVHLGLSGTARVHLAKLAGALQVSAGDRASLVIDHAHAEALAGQFLGQAQASISDSRLNAVSLVTAQSASVTVLGEAQVATLTAHGDSVINIESVTGALLRHGDGNVRVSRYNGMIVDRRDAGLAVPGAASSPLTPPVPPPSVQPPSGGEQP